MCRKQEERQEGTCDKYRIKPTMIKIELYVAAKNICDDQPATQSPNFSKFKETFNQKWKQNFIQN